MILYDGTSEIDWFYDGVKSRGEMDGDARYPQDGRAVLYDNGAGRVYDWRLLDVLCDEYDVEKTEDAQADFDAVVAAMNTPKPTTDQRVTDMEAQMDALLGLSEEVADA